MPHNAKVDFVVTRVSKCSVVADCVPQHPLPLSTPSPWQLILWLPSPHVPNPSTIGPVLLTLPLCFISSHQLPGSGPPQQRPVELLSCARELHLQLHVHLFLRGGVCSDGSRGTLVCGHRELDQASPCLCRYGGTPCSSSTGVCVCVSSFLQHILNVVVGTPVAWVL